MTLLELSITCALIGILAAIAVPTYAKTIEKLRVSQASTDLMKIMVYIGSHRSTSGVVPDTLTGATGIPV